MHFGLEWQKQKGMKYMNCTSLDLGCEYYVNRFGDSHNEKLDKLNQLLIDTDTDIDANGDSFIVVGENFGCIHWKNKVITG